MVKYKDVLIKDKGGRTIETLNNGKKEIFRIDDGEYLALRIAELYGNKAMNEFYDSYKKG